MTASLERSQAELEKRTRELERSNRDLEDFASVASHDLQEPLVTISRFGEVLSRRLRGRDDPDAEIADNVVKGSNRLRDLVRDLLAYSRMGRGEPKRDAVDLDDVVRLAMENLAGPIEQAGADVDVEPLPTVTGDARRLSQVMQNLLANAVKFSDEDHPMIRVTAKVRDEECIVSVADNGIGFEPEQAEQIFRAFHRLNAGERFSGSGIGLAVCERIVTQHGGRIWAEGRVGEGATFSFSLPLAERPAVAAAPS
jgi:light-regulated signal transduction histidine kinase (bacteriophytochrome)